MLTLHSGSELMADAKGLCNPYVVVHVLGNRPKTSKTVWHTTEPVWEQEIEFEGFLSDLSSSGIIVKVYSRYLCERNAFIGRASVFLRQLQRGRQLPFDNIQLERTPMGNVSFSVRFELTPVFALFPGTPIHASAAQALHRQPPPDAKWWELQRDKLLLLLSHKFFLGVAVVWLVALLGWGTLIAILYLGLFMLPEGALGMSEDQIK